MRGTSAGVESSDPGTVYLLHFSEPYQHARHYLGWSAQLATRLDHHANGRGSTLCAAASRAGITWVVARTWSGNRDFERRLHARRGNVRLCPICSPNLRWAMEGANVRVQLCVEIDLREHTLKLRPGDLDRSVYDAQHEIMGDIQRLLTGNSLVATCRIEPIDPADGEEEGELNEEEEQS